MTFQKANTQNIPSLQLSQLRSPNIPRAHKPVPKGYDGVHGTVIIIANNIPCVSELAEFTRALIAKARNRFLHGCDT